MMNNREGSGAESLLAEAVEHHRAGRLDAAEPLYLEALRLAPGHWRAANNLGALYVSKHLSTRALSVLETAMASAPDKGPVWTTYAGALIQAEAFERAERLVAEFAADARSTAVELRLRQAWGAALMRGLKPTDAATQFARALELAPDAAEAHGDLGYALTLKGDFAGAEKRLRRATDLAPDNVGIRLNLGSALMRLGQYPAAEQAYRAALALDGGNAAASQNLRVLLTRMDRGDEADGLAATANSAPFKALAARIRGQALLHRGSYAEAITQFDQSLALEAGDPETLCERAFLRLLVRDFAGGWEDYEARWRLDRFVNAPTIVASPPVHLRFDPKLKAGDLAGRRVLLIAEQGIGDQVMFASLIPDLQRTAGEITLVCDPRLVRLLAHSFPDIEVTAPDQAKIGLDAFDRIVPMGGLARIYRKAEANFPATPYLLARAQVRERWAEKLGPRRQNLRIGVSWRGGVERTAETRRSLSLEALRPVLDLPGCEFVSLQYGDVAEEVAAFNAGRDEPIRLFPRAELGDFEELAALVGELDVVVSVQTALVHLCGGLGKQALVLIPHRPEWRYTARGDTMPWYGSVRLFRQPTPGDWETPRARIVDELRRMPQRPSA